MVLLELLRFHLKNDFGWWFSGKKQKYFKDFSLVNIGERTESGFPLILSATEDENLPTPTIEESFNPSQTKLIFYVNKLANENAPENVPNEVPNNFLNESTDELKLIKYIKAHPNATRAELATYINKSYKAVQRIVKSSTKIKHTGLPRSGKYEIIE